MLTVLLLSAAGAVTWLSLGLGLALLIGRGIARAEEQHEAAERAERELLIPAPR